MTSAAASSPLPSELLAALRACPEDHVLWDTLRAQQFPGARVNLNPGTLGTPSRAALAAQAAFWADDLRACPLGQYERGRDDLRRARALAASLWGGTPLIAGGASEAMTRVTAALRERLAGAAPIRVLTSGHEHAGGVAGFQRHPAFACETLPDAALADPGAVADAAARGRCEVLLLSQITYTIGQVVPVAEICARVRARRPDAWIVVDAAQALGLVAPELSGADVAVASGHKWLFGPPGTGFLWLGERARRELAAPGWAGEPLDPESPCPALERAGGHDLSVYAGLHAALALHAALGPAVVRARSRALAAWFAAELHARLLARGVDHRFFDPASGRAVPGPPPEPVGAVHLALARDPYPAYARLHARGVHLKCIKRPGLALLRAGLPCHETPARLVPVLDALAEALADRPGDADRVDLA